MNLIANGFITLIRVEEKRTVASASIMIESHTAEKWEDIKGFEGYYQISTHGNVRSLNRTVKGRYGTYVRKGVHLAKKLSKDGYEQVNLYISGKMYCKQVHRLVCETFLLNPKNKEQVNHKDGIKTNNCISNLEWVTRLENMKHATQIGLLPTGEKHHKSKLTDSQVAWIRKVYKKGDSEFGQGALSRLLGVQQSLISHIVNRQIHKGIAI